MLGAPDADTVAYLNHRKKLRTRTGPESSTQPRRLRLTPEDVARATIVRRIAGRNLSKADVLFVEIDGRSVAVKDYAPRPFAARQTVGRWLIRRECRAYETAGAIPGLAPFLGRIGAFALATAKIDATPLAELPPGTLDDATFDRLDGILDELHARGVAISDLHHRDVLLAADRDVYVVDLAAAYVCGGDASSWKRSIFERLCAQDRLAAARMRARFTGVSEAEALERLDPEAVRRWGKGRRVKAAWDRLRGKGA